MPAHSYTPLELIERLVSFDTTSRNSNLQLIDFVADYLAGHGVKSTLIHDASGTKANLFATLGPPEAGGIVLSGHTDVVPVDGQDWHSDPFSVRRRDNRLYGRGTADMKSFCATALALVPEYLSQPRSTPLHLAFSYDEEVGCLGVHGIVKHLHAIGKRPRLCIVGEPTEMQVVDTHKASMGVDTSVVGLEAHSSAPHTGVNAVMVAADMISFLGRLAEELKGRKVPGAERFDPPYTTVDVGTVQGGTARNIVPRHCRFGWGVRAIPGTDLAEPLDRLERFAEQELLPRMRKVHAGAEIIHEVRARIAALRPEPGSPAESLVLSLVESNQTLAVSYGTEGGLFQEAGIPTVVCGPGNIRDAHKPDEFIELSQVAACEGFMRKLLQRMAA